jgi:NADP-dependent 3-hydroxy acid dehydrogenase YdfG
MRNLTAADGELAQMCTLLELDVTDPAAVTRAVLQIVDREGRIDAVVNNAGYVLWGQSRKHRSKASSASSM